MKVTGAKLTRRSAGRCSVKIVTDAGASGVAVTDAAAGRHLLGVATDFVVGTDPRAVTGTWERMHRAAGKQTAGPLRRAVAALDVALWDLKAKAVGEPLWRTLGGGPPRANAHAACRKAGLADRELSAWFGRMARDFGLRGGMLRAGSDPTADRRRLGLARDALVQAAAEPALMLDAGGRWPAAEAIRRIRALESDFDLTWIEGAARGGGAAALKRISERVSAAVCAGAGLGSIAEFRTHFERRSVDVVQLDLAQVGISGALVIADAAFGLELPVVLMAAPGNIHAHLAGVIPGFMSMEVVDPAPGDREFSTGVRIEDGWGVAGNAPGHGLVPA